jgi:CheY-like chemotaxis protein
MRSGAHLCKGDWVPIIRCLIVDDNSAFMAAARVLLEREGLVVAGCASNSAEALVETERLRPDVVLVDISLGEESGFDLVRRLREDGGVGSEAAVVMISTRAEEDVADLVAESPVSGFVSKSDLSASAIRRLVDGDLSARRGT